MNQLAENLWEDRRTFKLAGMLSLGGRMTVVRLGNGSLWLHSPVKTADYAPLERLGRVGHVVAPNSVHHLYVKGYQERYGGARYYAVEGLPEKRPDLRFDAVLAGEPPREWNGEFDMTVMRLASKFVEAAFCHRPTRTLILTDLCFNIQDIDTLAGKLYWKLAGGYKRFGPTRILKLMARDRRALKEGVDRILTWDFDRITVTHGEIVPRDGKRLFKEAFSWLHK